MPLSVSPYQTLTITGSSFGATEPITVFWDSSVLTHTSSSVSGSFVVTATVPQAAIGPHSVGAAGGVSHRTASAVVQIKPATFLSRRYGAQGTRLTLSGVGFGATEPVKAYWLPGYLPLGSPPGSVVTTTALGTFTGASAISVTVPLSPTGTYYIAAVGQTRRAIAYSAFTIIPALGIVPTSGAHGSAATVSASGFKANDTVTVYWDCSAASCGSTTVLGSKLASASGDVSVGVTIPATATVGLHTLGAKGSSSAFAATTYNVTS